MEQTDSLSNSQWKVKQKNRPLKGPYPCGVLNEQDVWNSRSAHILAAEGERDRNKKKRGILSSYGEDVDCGLLSYDAVWSCR